MARFMRWLKSWVCRAQATEQHVVVFARPAAGMSKHVTMPNTFKWPSSLVVLDEPSKSEIEQWHVGWH